MAGRVDIRHNMDVVGSDGRKLGEVGYLLVGDRTGEPRFFTVHKGFLLHRDVLVPREAATRVDGEGRLHVDLDRDQMDALPDFTGRPPTDEEVRRAYRTLGAQDLGERFQLYMVPFSGTQPREAVTVDMEPYRVVGQGKEGSG